MKIKETETFILNQDDINHPSQSRILNQLAKDSELCNCVNAIRKSLEIKNIEDLKPLEEAIVSESERTIELLRKQWNVAQEIEKKLDPVVDIENLRESWNSSPNISDISKIVAKWNK